MNIAVCTLFEGNYGLGAGVLINSLVRHGFRGTIYAGFRGPRPFWVDSLVESPNTSGVPAKFEIRPDVYLELLPLETSSHLTNYKPEFMLSLLRGHASDADALLYLDPDVLVNEDWQFFQDWLSCGVALCEDVNSPLHHSHPRRNGWRKFYADRGIELRGGESFYVNGGAIGVSKADIEFVELWEQTTRMMGEKIGGLQATKVAGGHKLAMRGFAGCFDCSDQDSLNASIEAYRGAISLLGQEAMALKPGHAVLPHALGGRKPWNCSYLVGAFAGRPARLVDKLFWMDADSPIQVFTAGRIALKQVAIRFSAALGRVYMRRW